MKTGTFPLPFDSLRIVSAERGCPYVIGAMFTAAYSEKASRLAASCDKLKLSYCIHEVPSVHRSISSRGNDNLSYTKPNFISHLLVQQRKPVLYLDADCEIESRPELIEQLISSRRDFAIFNAYAEECTDRFVPIKVLLTEGADPIIDRFYRFAGSTRWHTTKQLGCSGLVQFWGNTIAARALLLRWHRTIVTFPSSADDSCLDFVFNNLSRRSWLWWRLKVYWLPKSYARISWWIHTKPVINHPGFPAWKTKFVPIEGPKGRKEVYKSDMQWKNPSNPFPRDCIIDTERHMLCKLVEGRPIPVMPIAQQFWL